MEQLRIQRKDIYEIEVNDNGDTLRFPIGDIALPFRLNEAYSEIGKIQKRLENEIVIIQKQQDHKVKHSAMTSNQIAIVKAQDKAYSDMRKAMDKFLGEGGCQKVFGDANYKEMYLDLFGEFTKKDENGLSHFDKMRIAGEAIDKRIEEKYNQSKSSQVI